MFGDTIDDEALAALAEGWPGDKPRSERMRRQTKKPVVIKSVTVRSSTQLKSFQHIHIEASADVPAGEEPEYVVGQLKLFVAKELKVAREGRVVPQPAVQGRFLDLTKPELG